MRGGSLLLPFSCMALVIIMLISPANCDFNQDQKECADQLVGILPCLPYVSGQSNVPTTDCCTGLKQVVKSSQKCICILIKDKDDPNLASFKINATRAATLPTYCHTPSNISDCIALLHLPPNSAEAKMFQGFANITQSQSNVTPTSTSSSSSSSSSGKEKSSNDGGKGKRWMIGNNVVHVMFLLWISQMINLI
ncbi:hypothetical protein ACFE04_007526 [Oxalis oulophora]